MRDVLARDGCSPGGMGALGSLCVPLSTGAHRPPQVFSLLRNEFILHKLTPSAQEGAGMGSPRGSCAIYAGSLHA